MGDDKPLFHYPLKLYILALVWSNPFNIHQL